MTRKTKLSYNECKAELQLFALAAYKQYESNSYAAGYFESMLAEVMANMPKSAQANLVTQIRKSRVLNPTVD